MIRIVVNRKSNNVTVRTTKRKINVTKPSNKIVVKTVRRGEPGQQGEQGDPGLGLPTGGQIGDVIQKTGSADYEVGWLVPTYSDKSYRQDFAPSLTVNVHHNLGKYPAVSVVNSAGDEVIGEVTYTDTNSLVVGFSALFGGTVYCN